MTTISVSANDVLDLISEAKCSLEQFQKGNVDVDRYPLALNEAENGYPSILTRGTDFWWDIDNHVMWSFNKNFMNRLTKYLANSFKVMS